MDNNTNKVIRLGGRVVAVLRGRVLDIRRHQNGFLYDPNHGQGQAIAIAQSVLHEARKASMFRVTNLDTGDMYCISRADFDKWSYPVQNSGYELQRACAIRHWAYTASGSYNVPLPIESHPVPTPQVAPRRHGDASQPGLFG